MRELFGYKATLRLRDYDAGILKLDNAATRIYSEEHIRRIGKGELMHPSSRNRGGGKHPRQFIPESTDKIAYLNSRNPTEDY